MCGVPVERSDDYLHRLIAKGHRVAVCEQMEDPAAARARGNKSVVRRDVVRLVTPGTLTEDTCSTPRPTTIWRRSRAPAALPEPTALALPGSTFRRPNSWSRNAR